MNNAVLIEFPDLPEKDFQQYPKRGEETLYPEIEKYFTEQDITPVKGSGYVAYTVARIGTEEDNNLYIYPRFVVGWQGEEHPREILLQLAQKFPGLAFKNINV